MLASCKPPAAAAHLGLLILWQQADHDVLVGHCCYGHSRGIASGASSATRPHAVVICRGIKPRRLLTSPQVHRLLHVKWIYNNLEYKEAGTLIPGNQDPGTPLLTRLPGSEAWTCCWTQASLQDVHET